MLDHDASLAVSAFRGDVSRGWCAHDIQIEDIPLAAVDNAFMAILLSQPCSVLTMVQATSWRRGTRGGCFKFGPAC